MFRVVESRTYEQGLYSVVDAAGDVVPDVERFLRYLAAGQRSVNTVRAYAYDVRDYFSFLSRQQLEWRRATLQDLADFALSLRGSLGQAPLQLIPGSSLSARSINRKLAGVTAFYDYSCRIERDVSHPLALTAAGGRPSQYKSFLHHAKSPGQEKRRPLVLKTPGRRITTLTEREVAMIIDATLHVRDRLLFTVLAETGLRLGEALGLRHDDIDITRRTVAVVRRRNENGALAKSRSDRELPVPDEVLRLYCDFLEYEGGMVDSDYVFVNLWGGAVGAPMTASTVYQIVHRLKSRSGVAFSPHMFRHTYATELLRAEVPLAVVQALLGHASAETTSKIYGHLTPEDTRSALRKAGYLDGARGGDR